MSNRPFFLNTIMPFGSHQGEMIEDMLDDEPDYLAWLYQCDNIEFDLEVIREMEDRKII